MNDIDVMMKAAVVVIGVFSCLQCMCSPLEGPTLIGKTGGITETQTNTYMCISNLEHLNQSVTCG